MAEDLFSSPTSFTPPNSAEDRLAWLRLIRSRRVGPATFRRLMAAHGSAQAAIAALPEIAQSSGVSGYEPCPPSVALAEIRAAEKAGATMLCLGDSDYPEALANIADAPPLLWALGDRAVLRRPMVALVGARNASSLGLRMARRLARELSEAGICVVSGLARGIDAAAHAAALEPVAGGGTVAVHAGGVDNIYPPEHRDLAARIAAGGCRLSEHPPGMEPQARHFPQRNRLVSGLSHAVIVVEAAERSGSLITAACANDQGREVMAVPGHPVDPRAGGCNLLIRQGATLVRSISDVMEVLGPMATPVGRAPGPLRPRPAASVMPVPPPPAPGAPADLAQAILERLGPSPLAEDQLIRDLGAAPGVVAGALVTLELEGMVQRHPGGLLSLGGDIPAGAARHSALRPSTVD